MNIDTELFSKQLRAKSIDVEKETLLVTNLLGTQQEQDLSNAPNCNGYGRIHTFRRQGTPGWPENPIPIDPAANKLGLSRGQDVIRAQVFQNASCNWRCWYCYVPFNLLNANTKHSGWLSAHDLIELYEMEADYPKVIDLSGGQPDLTPEWVSWMMKSLRDRMLDTSVYLWSDDNLSNDYFWRYLPKSDIKLITEYRNYGKVCCFKGFNPESFSFNTKADPELFGQQQTLFRKYLSLGIDLYAYATFTAPSDAHIAVEMQNFVDQLQTISPNLPLRVVPLEIREFSPVHSRSNTDVQRAIKAQWSAIECWKSELVKRFTTELRNQPIYEVTL